MGQEPTGLGTTGLGRSLRHLVDMESPPDGGGDLPTQALHVWNSYIHPIDVVTCMDVLSLYESFGLLFITRPTCHLMCFPNHRAKHLPNLHILRTLGPRRGPWPDPTKCLVPLRGIAAADFESAAPTSSEAEVQRGVQRDEGDPYWMILVLI